MAYGLYISAEGAQAQSQRIEVLSNNLANVDTPGFKNQLAVIQARHSEAIDTGSDYPGSRSINDVGGGAYVSETPTSFAQGILKQTGVPTDLAIDGDGFFLVQQDGKELLTRAGNFQMTNDGRLVTPNGLPVLGEDRQPVTIDAELPWRMLDNGSISQEGVSLPLALVKPASLGDLVKVGHNLFSPLAATTQLAPELRRVRSGYIEQSTVKPALEMMELIEASRAFEANIRLIQNHDQVTGSLVSRVLQA